MHLESRLFRSGPEVLRDRSKIPVKAAACGDGGRLLFLPPRG